MKDLTSRIDEELATATKVAKRENAKLQQRVGMALKSVVISNHYFQSINRLQNLKVNLRLSQRPRQMHKETSEGEFSLFANFALYGEV